MINFALYRREMKKSAVPFIILAAVMTMYISVIISMYDPVLMNSLDEWVNIMPEIMAAAGMSAGATTLIGFMSSYLYGFILLIIPMVFSILRANGLIARYIDRGSMAYLVAAPVKRRTAALTQMSVLISGIVLTIVYATILEMLCASQFPDTLDLGELLALNGGLLCLHLFIGSVCFFCSCLFSDTKYSIGFGAGIPALMMILQMLANTGGDAENIKYATFFTLYNPSKILAGETSAIIGIFALLVAAALLFGASVAVFSKKDLHI